MTQPADPGRPATFWGAPYTRWLVWGLFLVLWTAALLAPLQSSGDSTSFELNLRFVRNKSIHVGCYAVLAGLTGWLAVSQRYRWVLMFLITAHTGLTELLQGSVAGRTGQVLDVVFDFVGLALGLLWSYRWWVAPDQERASRDGSGPAQMPGDTKSA